MKEYDYVKLTVEKEKYSKYGVHKGAKGWICDPRVIEECRLVSFEDEFDNEIACIAVKTDDLKLFWIAPSKQVGCRVTAYPRVCEKLGIRVGLKGTIVGQLEDDKWRVRFSAGKDNGEVEFVLDNDDFSFDPDEWDFNNALTGSGYVDSAD